MSSFVTTDCEGLIATPVMARLVNLKNSRLPIPINKVIKDVNN